MIVAPVMITVANIATEISASVRPMRRFDSATFSRNSYAVSGNSSAAEFDPLQLCRAFQRRSNHPPALAHHLSQ